MKEIIRAHLYISGIVQGVFFRSHTENVARSLNVTGWVRNLSDGRVEVVAEGSKEKVEELIQWCHKGPDFASVEHVEIHWEDAMDEFKDFEIRYRY
ncbi:MAG: acylphosphatase [candidate division WOR-3 bacterium]|nr:MAG: acylphosphatase [candidate division WOR-3 bacterium]